MEEIILETPKIITVTTEVKKTINKFKVIGHTEDVEAKVVNVFVRLNDEEIPVSYQLWKDSEMEKVGQYTDSDIETRAKEIINTLT